MMHAAVGTALGGVCTLVGEPQNLLIGERPGWHFGEFFVKVRPVSMPVLVVRAADLPAARTSAAGSDTARCLPEPVREVIERCDRLTTRAMAPASACALIVQAHRGGCSWSSALALHLAEVGLIGLTVIILTTAFNGIVEEQRIGHAFEEALPFTALLVVFFAIVALIHEQHLFDAGGPLGARRRRHVAAGLVYVANGLLSAISDNVFVATVYISEIQRGLPGGCHVARAVRACSRSRSTPAPTSRAWRPRTDRRHSCSC